jgi:hypothetical protein
MKWLSPGGPLVLVATDMASAWEGATGEDYNLACTVRDFASLVRWKGTGVLVLGDEPLPTCVYEDEQGSMFARWYYAPSDEDVNSALRGIRPHLRTPIEDIEFEAQSENYILFDASESGRELSDRIDVYSSRGRYALRSYLFRNGSVSLLIHSLE